MDNIWITVLFVYIIIATLDFRYLCRREDNDSSLFGNFFESFLWPVVFPLMAIFYAIIFVFDSVLYIIRYIKKRHFQYKRDHDGQ